MTSLPNNNASSVETDFATFTPLSHNLLVNYSLSRDIVINAKASLLIESSVTTGIFIPFIDREPSQPLGGHSFKLPEPIVLHEYLFNEKTSLKSKYKIEFTEFEVITKASFAKGRYGQAGRIRLKVNEDPFSHICANHDDIFCSDRWGVNIDQVVKKAIEKFKDIDVFDLFKDIMKYDAPEKVCGFFKVIPTPYSSFKLASKEFLRANLDDLNTIHNVTYQKKTYEHLESYFFKNKDDCMCMIACSFWDQMNQSTFTLPVSVLAQKRSIRKKYISVPFFPGKQILFNLPDILSENTKKVVITDNIGIAAVNQEKADVGTAWTSFLCDPEHYDQVDWTPLKQVEEVYLLITNHSGFCLGEAYKRLRPLAEYLKNEQSIELKFIQTEVNYAFRLPFFESVDEVKRFHKKHPPRAIPESMRVMNNTEFENMYNKAVASLAAPPFWSDGKLFQQSAESDVEQKSGPIPFLFRPFAVEGGVVIGHAPTGHGKSCFFLSMSAAIVSGEKFIAGLSWNLVKSTEYKYQKVLYLDFESGKKLIDHRIKSLVYSYFPSIAKEKQRCVDNLIIKDLSKGTVDYSVPANHQKIIDMVGAAVQAGEKGQPVDLVVIDTFGSLVGTEHSHSWDRIEPLLKKLSSMTAVLIIDHSVEDGSKLAGYMRKKRMCVNELKLFRPDVENTTLKDPMHIKIGKGRVVETAREKTEFRVHWNGYRWVLYKPGADLKIEELKDFGLTVKQYQELEYSRDSICTMMGLKKSSYSERMKKYKEAFPYDIIEDASQVIDKIITDDDL